LYGQTEKHDNEISPEVKMWRYVIKRAILDSCAIFEDSKPYRNKDSFLQESIDWFKSEDCEVVCLNANLNVDFVKKLQRNASWCYNENRMRSSLLSALLDKILERNYEIHSIREGISDRTW